MLFKHKHLILEFWALLFSIRFLYISPGFSLVLLQPLFSGTSTVGLVSGWALQTQVSWFLVPSKRWELAESSAQPCKRLLHVGARFECHTKSSTYVPGSKVAIWWNGHPTFNRESLQWVYKPLLLGWWPSPIVLPRFGQSRSSGHCTPCHNGGYEQLQKWNVISHPINSKDTEIQSLAIRYWTQIARKIKNNLINEPSS